jgi:O-glycosyl hydrolase
MLAPKIQDSGLKTVISASDETNIASCIKVLKAYQSAGDILDKVGQLNTHTYSGNNAERVEAYQLTQSIGKPFWQSETGPSGRSKNSLGSNLGLAQKLFDDMRYMKPIAWLDWQLIEESNDVWCLMRCNFKSQQYQIVKNFYVRMQITRFFRQGYTLIETGNDQVLAAINPDKTELVISLVNSSDQAQEYRLNLDKPINFRREVRAFLTSETENCSSVLIAKPAEKSISYATPAQSLTTLVVPLKN